MTDQPKSAPPGWYPHPSMANTQRYWDGEKWTDHTAPANALPPQPKTPPADSARSKADWKRRIAVIAVLALVFGGLWFFLVYRSGENRAVRACHNYVELRLKAPATADFSSESAHREYDGDDWVATGIVDSENGFGAKVRNVFTCDVDDNFRVTDADFSEDE